jgi:negative regulator of sigma E activity
MNLDQELFLTAYLDGELPLAAREGVASALATDPRLAEDLRALRTVRDLVAGLSRSVATIDVSAAVLAEIGQHRPEVIRGWFPLTSGSARILGLVASAAAVVAALTVGLARHDPRPARPSVVQLPRTPFPVAKPSPPPVLARLDPPAIDARPDPGERRRDEEARKVHRWLDDPSLQKVLVVTDVQGGDAHRRVGTILESTPRKHAEFGRITVAQGIVVDPEHPGQATVYAVVMDDRELGDLRQKLTTAFPAGFQERSTRPEVVSRLADIGQIALLPGKPVSDLLEDRVKERQRAKQESEVSTPRMSDVVVAPGSDSDPLRDPNRIEIVTTDEANGDDPPSLERMASGPHPIVSKQRAEAEKLANSSPAPASPRTAQPPARPPHPRPQVVLVWVASPAGGRER